MKLLGRSQLVAFAAVTIMAVGVGAALANTQNHNPPNHRGKHGSHGACSPAQVQRNKATVVAYYTTAFNDKKPEEAVAKYGGPVYIQHNPLAADGFQAFIDFVKAYTGANPQLHVDIKRVIGECDLVVTHSHIRRGRLRRKTTAPPITIRIRPARAIPAKGTSDSRRSPPLK